MFEKLISRFHEKTTPDHPLASDEGLNALMAGISQADPGRLLFDIDDSLAGMEATVAEIGPALALRALARLDQFARPSALQLLWRYLSVGQREYMADSAWSALDVHAGHLFRCYGSFLNAQEEFKNEDDKLRMARCAARMLRAWGLRKKLQRFRYRTPGADLWLEVHKLLQVIGRAGLQQTRVVAYRNEEPTTPLAEYLIGLYLEFVPAGNMVPQQLEIASRFLRSCGRLELTPQAHALSTARIDLAGANGPQPIKSGDTGGDSIRYCSVSKLRGALMTFAAHLNKLDECPGWLVDVPASPEQIRGATVTLMAHWASAPPKRGKDRKGQNLALKIVLGFALARRMIALAQFAREGRSFKYEGDDIDRLFDESRFGSVDEPDPAATEAVEEVAAQEVGSPLEILQKLELGGDLAQMERWLEVDESATGLGAVVPAILPRHRIGSLICFRSEESIDWRMGLIRRIGRDAANRPRIGIETLAWPSLCALAKPVGEESIWTKLADGGHGWSDAIIVSGDGREVILQAGSFVAGMDIDVRSEDGASRVRMESLLDRGPDYDRIHFTRIS